MNKHPTRPPPPTSSHTHLPVAAGQDPQPRALKASVLEAETRGVSSGVGHRLEGQGSPPAGAELQPRDWEGATWEP